MTSRLTWLGRTLAVVGVLGLAACAAPGPTAPIVLAADQGLRTAEAAADTMLYQPVQYTLATELPEMATDAPAYRAQGNAVTRSSAERLARALGLPGPVERMEWGGHWDAWTVVGPDASSPRLTVNEGPLGDWWYGGAVTRVCAESPTPEGEWAANGASDRAPAESVTGCGPAAPANGLPADAEARRQAQSLLAATGGWLGDDVRINRDDYGVSVEFRSALGGVPTPYSSTVRFGAQGVVEYASGYLGTPESAGSFPRIGTAAAFDLLRSGTAAPWDVAAAQRGIAGVAPAAAGGGSEGGTGSAGTGVDTIDPSVDAVTDEPGTTEPGIAEPSGATDPGVTDPGVTDPPLIGEPGPLPVPEMITSTITITGVREGLWSLYGADDSIWFVPSYVFLSADGGEYPVAAIPAGLVQVESQPVPMRDLGSSAPDPARDEPVSAPAAPASTGREQRLSTGEA